MTREEAVLILTRLEKGCDEYAELTNYAKEALQMALTALSAQTDGDVISRQAAIDALKPLPTIEGLSLQPLITVDDVIKVLNGLPSAQPEQTDCEYCHEDIDGYVKPIEKNCHAFIRFGMNGWCLELCAKGWHGETKINYCPMCGRRLRNG